MKAPGRSACAPAAVLSADAKTQPRPALIFRGQGLRISDIERAAWHKDVDVSFNQKAWANDEWCLQHIPKQLAPVVPRAVVRRCSLRQPVWPSSAEFRKSLKAKLNVLRNLQPGTTDITQPVVSGLPSRSQAIDRCPAMRMAGQ